MPLNSKEPTWRRCVDFKRAIAGIAMFSIDRYPESPEGANKEI